MNQRGANLRVFNVVAVGVSLLLSTAFGTSSVQSGQDPSSDAPQLTELVHKYRAGNDSAANLITAAGPGAMHALLPFRGDSRVARLMQKLRLAAARECDVGSPGLGKSLGRMTLPASLNGEGFQNLASHLSRKGISLVPDPAAVDLQIRSAVIRWTGEKTALQVLEDTCRKEKLDFVYVYDEIVFVAAPARLWPASAYVPRPLGLETRTRAERAIRTLSDESVDRREKAAGELRKLGPDVLPLLRQSLIGAGPERAGRLRDLIHGLTPRRGRLIDFRRPAGDRRTEGEAASKLEERLRSMRVTTEWRNVEAAVFLKLSGSIIGVDPDLRGIPQGKVSLTSRGLRGWTILTLFTRSLNLDFTIRDGKLLIGPEKEFRK